MNKSTKIIIGFLLLFLIIGVASANDDLNDTAVSQPQQVIDNDDDLSLVVDDDNQDFLNEYSNENQLNEDKNQDLLAEDTKIETKVNISRSYDLDGNINLEISLSDFEGNAIDDNVTVTFDNDNKIINTVNGTAFVKFFNPLCGNNSIIAQYGGNSVYAPSSMTLDRINPFSYVTYTTPKYMKDFYFIFYMNDISEGMVNVTLGASIYSAPVVNGTARVKVLCQDVGRFGGRATYYGNNEYNASTVKFAFRTYKADPTPFFYVPFKYENYTQVIVLMDRFYPGNPKIIFNGTVYDANFSMRYPGIIAPCYFYHIPGMELGKNNITIFSDESLDYFNPFSINETLNVKRPNMDIDLYINGELSHLLPVQNYTGVVNFKLGFSSESNGNVIINIGGHNYTYNLNYSRELNVNITGLEPGTYEYEISFTDEVYRDQKITGRIFIQKVKCPYDFDMTVNNITYGDDAVVDITTDGMGEMTLTINGRNYTATARDGKAKFIIPNLSPDVYEFTVSYPENATHLALEKEGIFIVNSHDSSKSDVDMAIEAFAIHCFENATINLIFSDDATGEVRLNIDAEDHYAEIINGKATFVIHDLPSGDNVFKIYYGGDAKYSELITYSSIHVDKIIPKAEISSFDLFVNDFASFKIVSEYQGYVSIRTGNRIGLYYMDKGNLFYEVTTSKPGNYTIEVKFLENDIYLELVKTVNYTVFGEDDSKHTLNDSEITIEVGNTTFGQNIYVDIYAPQNITGNVSLMLGSSVYNAQWIDGRARFALPLQYVGEGNFRISYLGDEFYNGFNRRASFNITKATPTINLTIDDVDYGTIPKLNISADFITISEISIEYLNRTINRTLTDSLTYSPQIFDCGTYTIKVIFNGNDNYNPASANITFSIKKKDPSISVSVKDIDYGKEEQITIYIYSELNGFISVSVGGETTQYDASNKSIIQINKTGLKAGMHVVEVEFSGDSNHNPMTVSENFTVNKINSTIQVSSHDIDLGQSETITVNLVKAGNGTVTLTIGNQTYTRDVDEDLTFTFENLQSGTYNVTVTYSGDDNYYSSTAEDSFSVGKVLPSVSIETIGCKYGQTAQVTVTLNSDATGQVTLTVSNQTITQNVVGGEVHFDITDLMPSNYTIIIQYGGDDQYLKRTAYDELVIEKLSPNLGLTIRNYKGLAGGIKYGEIAIATITIADDATGNITLKVGNFTYSGEAVNGFKINITGLDIGFNEANLTYEGDEIYNADVRTAGVNVGKASPKISLETINAVYGENVVVRASINATGELNLTFGNVTLTEKIIDNVATFNISNLNAGSYSFNVTYPGNDYYNSANAKGTFKVVKADANLTVNFNNITYGESARITVNMNANGNVSLTVNKKTYTQSIENGETVFEIDNLNANAYVVKAYFAGNENFNTSTVTTNLEVMKATPVFEIESNDVEYGNDVIVIIKTNVTGEFKLEFDNKSYSDYVLDGEVRFNISNMNSGTYEFNVTYSGNNNYNADEATGIIKVFKINPTFEINAVNCSYGGNVTVNVVTDQTGTVKLIMSDRTLESPVKDGVAVFSIGGLDAGSYSANVTYDGDVNHNPFVSEVMFSVSKIDSSFEVNAVNCSYGGNVTVNVVTGLSGTVKLVMSDRTLESPIKDGVAVFSIGNLNVGDYSANVTYDGDVNHNPFVSAVSFSVFKIVSSLDVSAVNCTYGGNVTVNVVTNLSGKVKLIMQGKTLESSVNDGVAVFNIGGLDAGSYSANVTYVDDESYNATVRFTVFKADSNLEVSAVNCSYGENITVTVVTNHTGKVKLVMQGKTLESSVNDGVAVFSIGGLDAGSYSANVTYDGDVNHNPFDSQVMFSVSKLDSSFEFNVVNCSYGGNIIIEVTINQTGSLRLAMSDRTLTEDIVDNRAVFTISGLNAGNYTADLTYLGNVNYNPSTSDVSFKVSKIDSALSISLSNITYGENAIVNVEGISGGIVKLQVGNETYNSTVTNGTAKFTIPNLNAGTHDIIAVFDGDVNYNKASLKDSLTVGKAASRIGVIATDGPVNKDSTITVTLNTIGNVTIYLNDDEFTTISVNKQSQVKLSNLKVGKYVVKSTFGGNDNFKASEKQVAFEIFDKSQIKASDLKMNYLDGHKYTVTVYGADGNLASNVKVVFKIGKTKINSKTDKNGKAKIKITQIPKTYKITAEALGISVTKKLTVKQVLTLKKVKVKKSAKKLVLKATLKNGKKPIKSKKITFKFKGKKLTAKTNKKGIAKVTIKKSVLKKLKVGKKVKYQATYVKNTVSKTVKVKK